MLWIFEVLPREWEVYFANRIVSHRSKSPGIKTRTFGHYSLLFDWEGVKAAFTTHCGTELKDDSKTDELILYNFTSRLTWVLFITFLSVDAHELNVPQMQNSFGAQRQISPYGGCFPNSTNLCNIHGGHPTTIKANESHLTEDQFANLGKATIRKDGSWK